MIWIRISSLRGNSNRPCRIHDILLWETSSPQQSYLDWRRPHHNLLIYLLLAPDALWMDPANLWAESWILHYFWCTCCIPQGRCCAAVPSGIFSACCQTGAQIDSCRIPRRTNPLSTARISLVLRCWSLVHQLFSPSTPVSSNVCHTVLGDNPAACCAPSLCLLLILTECSSLFSLFSL